MLKVPERLDYLPRRYPKKSIYMIPRLRLLLPALAIMLAGAIVGWPYMAVWLEADELPNLAKELTKKPIYQNTASEVTYTGVDQKNRPYAIESTQAVEQAADQVELNAPKLTLDLENNEKVKLEAKKGFVNKEKKLIRLEGDVTLTHTMGYKFVTSEAWIDLGSYSAYSDKPVSGHGPTGQIYASKGFKIKKDQKTLEFFGRPELILKSKGLKKDAK
jgi:lipopolysaccharide export system protein LptC